VHESINANQLLPPAFTALASQYSAKN